MILMNAFKFIIFYSFLSNVNAQDCSFGPSIIGKKITKFHV